MIKIEDLKSVLRDMGVAGAGGAGFPTYGKLDTRAETILMNCAECEPLLRLHRQLLEHHTSEILEAFALIGEAVGAKEMIVGVKAAYKATVEALNQCLPGFPGIRIGLLEEVYPAGDEVVLIHELTGKTVRPGGLPIEQGVAVFNVETCYNVYKAAILHKPVTLKLISVVGAVASPKTLWAPIGMTVREVVEAAGGPVIPDPAYLSGGPMMGSLTVPSAVLTRTSNAIIVLPQNHPVILKKKKNTSIDLKRAAACCCQCSMCTDLCPRHLLGHPIDPKAFMLAATCRDVQKPDIFLNTMFCSSCGLCEMYSCNQGLSPRTLIGEYKAGLRKAGVRTPQVPAGQTDPARPWRKAPLNRLVARLGLSAYESEAPIVSEPLSASSVTILMSQHIGAPAGPCVRAGDFVQEGQTVGKAPEGLGIAVHASISGFVRTADARSVVIDSRKDITV